MQYQVLLSLLALTSLTTAAPATELALEASYATNLTARAAPEKQNAYCTRKSTGLDEVTIFGGCGEYGWGQDGNVIDANTSENLRGCGAVSNWQFTPYEGGKADTILDNSYGRNEGTFFKACWQLTFQIPHRAKQNCLGRAIKDSGGPAMKCQS